MSEWRPRISIDVDEELYNRFNNLFNWGTKNLILKTLLEHFVTALEEHGITLAYLLIDGKLKLFDGVKIETRRSVEDHRT